MIVNKQKRQAFETDNLKVSRQNLDDHIGFARAGQFSDRMATLMMRQDLIKGL
jgi:hypothetical protein